MGLERFMQFNLKITQVDTPILSRYEIEPFVFANMALVRPQGVKEQTWRQAFRQSYGFGLLGFFSSCATEVYYSYDIKAGEKLSEGKSTISFNLGID